MSATTFSGPVLVGPNKDPGGTYPFNQGPVVLQQTVAITQNSTNAVSQTIYLPGTGTGGGTANIIDILVDVLTAFDSGSSATLSVGNVAAGTQYAGSVDVKSATGRIRPTFTAAQLAAMSNQTVTGTAALQTGNVVVTVTPSGATTAGYVWVTIIYSQTS